MYHLSGLPIEFVLVIRVVSVVLLLIAVGFLIFQTLSFAWNKENAQIKCANLCAVIIIIAALSSQTDELLKVFQQLIASVGSAIWLYLYMRRRFTRQIPMDHEPNV
jgi:Gpi18-like mannosyltransferase